MQSDLIYLLNGKGKSEKQDLEIPPENASKEVKETVTIWQKASYDSSSFCPNVDFAWQKVQSRITTPSAKTRSLVPVYWAAACIAVLVAGGLVLLSRQGAVVDLAVGQVQVHASDEVKTLNLKDGSTVWLNSNSRLTYSNDNPRNLQLAGEAYFKVAHDAGRPFTVQMGKTEVTVLGTEFNMKETNETSQVSVLDGSVRLAALNKSLVLGKGQLAEVLSSENTIVKADIADHNFLSWKTGSLVFKNVSVRQIVNELNRHYRANIHLEQSQSDQCIVSISFKKLSLEESLNTLTTLLGGSYSQAGEKNSYIILGSCH